MAESGILANDLSGNHIGTLINFGWEMPTGHTEVEVTGELRQVSHGAGVTVVHLCSPGWRDEGETDEFVLEPLTPITVHA